MATRRLTLSQDTPSAISQSTTRSAIGINAPGEPGTDPALGGGMGKYSIPLNVYGKEVDGASLAAINLRSTGPSAELAPFSEINLIAHKGTLANPESTPVGWAVGNLCFISYVSQGNNGGFVGWDGSANIGSAVDRVGQIGCCNINISTQHGLFVMGSDGTLTYSIDGVEVLRVDANGIHGRIVP